MPHPRQRERRGAAGETRESVLAFVRRRLRAGSPPSVREVQAALGFRAVEGARKHLEALVAEGRLVKQSGTARGYRLPDEETAHAALVPIVGRVQAGAPSLAVEDIDGHVAIDARVHGHSASDARAHESWGSGAGASSDPERFFALRVRGESMRDAGILDGDLVIVKRGRNAKSGEIVVALVGDEATVKTLHVQRGRIELRPANPEFSPIVIREMDELALLGTVIEVRRYLASSAPSRRR
jgi:repressor LexA